MDSLFLLQFACFIFMFINAFIVALSCSACKMEEQTIRTFKMDDSSSHHRSGDTICDTDEVRIPCP